MASISVRKRLFSSKQHRSTRRNNSLHPGYLTSLLTRTNHSTIQTIGIYVRVFRTADHAGQIFIPHRPTASSTSALIALFQQLSDMLQNNEYVMLVSMDFSRAFDTIAHQPLVQKMKDLDLPGTIFKWLASYFNNRGHITKLHNVVSLSRRIYQREYNPGISHRSSFLRGR